jgi:hypothetical protein
MSPRIRKLLLFFLVANLPTISASISSVIAPPSIQADHPTQLSVDLSEWTDLYSSYRVQLAIETVHGKGGFWRFYQGACKLLNSTAITTPNVSITVPSTVGPNRAYQIQIDVFENSTFNALIPGTIGYHAAKANFTLTSATGETLPWENDFMWIGFPFYLYLILPCAAYKCASDCYEKYWPANKDAEDACPLRLSYECAGTCEGVLGAEWPSWEDAVAASNSGNTSLGRAENCNASSTGIGSGAASTFMGSVPGSTTVPATAPSTDSSTASSMASSTKSAAGGRMEVNILLCLLDAGAYASLGSFANL